eukprot:CAMPEP_0172519602 /NCGR_PEP_ID=MMETSP1066-20121228/291515_1 /TAXON_ID=671091 /ORGANISM="Coscinodiscus wailesii, Strain CCMP2513" /LENGTH=98 /DNA_ID=CAMNT_0013302221 /DNA_START=308 /DNA_END=601 /DNA_ORIENTATION=+
MSSLVPSNNYNHKRIASNHPWRSDGIENAENVRDGVSQLRQNPGMKQVRSSKHNGGAKNGASLNVHVNNHDMVTITQMVHEYLRGKMFGEGGFTKVYW